ncbi:MAG: ATPase [Clostridia bacterium]|nr:ATPase [Clostridia bacterium]
MWYCGWDGGGTKTEVLILSEGGEVLADQSFGPLNPNGASREKVKESIREAVAFMQGQPGGEAACGGLVIGVAGLSNQDVVRLMAEGLREAGWNGKYRLAGDQEIALAGAIDGHGAILIAGTGAICHGRTPAGEAFRVGGYGYLIDDGGSGYAIGRDILAAVARAFDGRGEKTVLSGMVQETLKFDEKSLQPMITWLYAPETGKKEIASLARLLPEALAAGDAVAKHIAEKAAEDLAELVLTGWRKTGMKDGELALTGSILNRVPEIRQRVEKKIEQNYPDIQVMLPRRSPAMGAALMAMG